MSTEHVRPAVVTGAARGIGAATARALAAGGAPVAVLDRDLPGVTAVAEEITRAGGDSLALHCDITDPASVTEAFAAASHRLGGVDHLVTCAGAYVSPQPTEEVSLETWRLVVDSNLTGTFLCLRAALPQTKERGYGRIVTIASNAGRSTATALGAEYTAAKAGVLGLTRHVAREAAPHNVLVNCVAPGPMSGERLDALSDSAAQDAIAAAIPVGRLGRPEEVAAVAAFLLSDAASFMAGATVDANGGILMI